MTEAVFLGIGLIPVCCGAYTDAKRRIIPNAIPISVGVLALFSGFLTDSISWPMRAMGLIPAAVMLLIALKRKGIGGGDIKLCAALGFFLGFYRFAVVFIIAALAGFVWSRAAREKYVPLGTLLAVGYLAVCAIIVLQAIMRI